MYIPKQETRDKRPHISNLLCLSLGVSIRFSSTIVNDDSVVMTTVVMTTGSIVQVIALVTQSKLTCTLVTLRITFLKLELFLTKYVHSLLTNNVISSRGLLCPLDTNILT